MNISDILDGFAGKRIAVVGDLILDHYVYGEVTRMSPEAPVPVVTVLQEQYCPGGAGNLACNIAALGGKPFLVSSVGNDEHGRLLAQELDRRGVDVQALVCDTTKLTTIKTRIIAKERHVVRVDREDCRDVTPAVIETALWLLFLGFESKNIDAVVISDYRKGFITKELAQYITPACGLHNKVLVVDTKPSHMEFFKGATVFTPNKNEAEIMVGRNIENDHDIEDAGKTLQRMTGAHIVLKLGEAGMALFEGEKYKRFSATARVVRDVVGAGDTVCAALSLACAAGASLSEAADIANTAAGIAVSKADTATVSLAELKQEIG